MSGIYIHIPFCKQLCSYCDFYFSVSLERRGEMLDALCREVALRSGYLRNTPVTTLYFGGGTPTVYSPAELGRLVDAVRETYRVDNFEEFTVECNPDDLTDEYLEGLAEIGVNRLSIGIQSFDDAHLTFFNRRHTSAEAAESVRRAQAHGFRNITIDLIYGIPDMSDEQWRANLEKAFSLNVQHLSAYHLTIEERTVFGKMAKRGKLYPVEERLSEQHYATLETMTASAGYEHYEVSNFAKKGFRAIHNSNYWRGIPYIGIGPSAHSFDGASRRWNVANNVKYMAALGTPECFEQEQLTPRDLRNEYVMTSLRTSDGVDLREIERRWGAESAGGLTAAAARFIETGELVGEGSKLKIPTSKFLLSDYIISNLFEVRDEN